MHAVSIKSAVNGSSSGLIFEKPCAAETNKEKFSTEALADREKGETGMV